MYELSLEFFSLFTSFVDYSPSVKELLLALLPIAARDGIYVHAMSILIVVYPLFFYIEISSQELSHQ